MGLIAWFPLNSNLQNLGTATVTFTTASGSSSLGATGRVTPYCYVNGSYSTGGYVSEQKISLGPTPSMFAWINFTELTANSNLGGSVLGTHRYPTYTGMGITIKYISSTTGYLSVNTGNGSSRTYNEYCGTTLLQANTWYHVGFTYDGATIKLYVNGVLDGTHSFTGMSIPDDYLMIGCWSLASSSFTDNNVYANYKLVGRINDARVYDHALSAKEVKEISKGLVLHYTFEDASNISPNIFDIENYLSSAHSMNTGTKATYSPSGFTITATGTDMFIEGMCYSLGATANSAWHLMPVEEGKTYRISYDLVAGPNLSKSYVCYFNSSRACVGASAYTGFSFSRYGTTNTYYYDFTVPTGYSITSVSFRLGKAGSAGEVITAEHWQLRRGTVMLAYTPADFSGSSKVTDSSGFRNNGTVYGNALVLSTDTNIGKYCVVFNNTANSAIVVGQGAKITEAITVSWWGYMDTWANYGRAISCTEGGGWNFEPSSGYMNWPVYLAGVGYKSCTSATALSSLSAGWHLFTGTYDGLESKLYIDGVLDKTLSCASTKTAIGYLAANGIFIGAEAAGTATTPTSPYFNGKISDVKIFATALSVDDVKAEYNRKAAIDKNGNLFTGEIVEIDSSTTKIDKNNFVASNLFATTMTLEDGSLWAPISVHYVPDGLNSANSNTFYYKSRNIWNNFGAINDLERPESGYYEFYVMNQPTLNGAFTWYRFKQNKNPFSATWDDVNPAQVGTNVIRIDSSATSSYGGMYWMNNSNCAMCFANGSSSNWFCCGARAYWGNYYIPSYNGEQGNGWQLVYMRISKHQARMFKNGVIIPTNIEEL